MKTQDTYHKKAMTQIAVRFHNESDAEIIAKIKSQPNQADYIRKLVRLDLEKKILHYSVYTTDSAWENEWFCGDYDDLAEAIKTAKELNARYVKVHEKCNRVIVYENRDDESGEDGEIVFDIGQ